MPKKSKSEPEPEQKSRSDSGATSKRSWLPIVGLVGIGVALLVGVLMYRANRTPDDDVQSTTVSKNDEQDSTNDDTDYTHLASVEAVQEKLTARLKKLSEKYDSPAGLKKEIVNQFAAGDFTSTGLSLDALESVYDSNSINVVRLPKQTPDIRDDETKTQATIGFTETLSQLLTPIFSEQDSTAKLRSKFKIFRIDVDQSRVTTSVLASFFSTNSKTSSGELNAVLRIEWLLGKGADERPLIRSINVEEYEAATFIGDSSVHFADCTRSLIRNAPQIARQISMGHEGWAARIPKLGSVGQYGLSIGDLNGDGLDDIYLAQPYGLKNRLLIQQPDGTTVDLAQQWNVDLCDHTRSSLIADIDNDGRQDLVVVAQTMVMVYQNVDNNRLVLKQRMFEARNGYSIAAADYDADGDLDFYVCAYDPITLTGSSFPFAYPMHDANNGGRNILYRNDGQWKFSDATEEVGLDVDNTRFSYAAGWQDFDNDGDQDLYVANDFGRNCFYKNDGGRFENVAAELEIEDQSFGMSVDWADVNHDQNMDLYVSNMYSTAGNRVSFQSSYMSDRQQMQNKMQYMARGNSLFLGSKEGKFLDVGGQANVFMGRWAWGSKFADLNNDGWDDVVVANGYLTREVGDL